MGNQANCPNCGANLRIVQCDDIIETTQPGILRRIFASQDHSFEHTVSDAVNPTPAAIAPAHVEPGERREMTTYRELDLRDVLVPLAFGLAGGTLLGLSAIPAAVAIRLPAWVPPVVWLGSSTTLFFATGWRIWRDKSLIVHETITERLHPPAPAEPQRTVRALKVEAVDQAGQYRKMANLPDTLPFWEFARRVTQGAPFTEETATACGLSVDVASWREPDEMGFRQIRDLFLDRGWARWKNPAHHQSGVELLAVGRHILRDYAATPPPQE